MRAGQTTDDEPGMGAAVAAAARSSRPTYAAPRRPPRRSRSSICGVSSTGDFKDASGALLGNYAWGLSPTSITRLDFLSAGCALVVLATVVEAQS